jgi:hypothetical protein
MVRLRNALLAATLAGGLAGCAHIHVGDYAHWSIFHCSECDDFPTPAYGPGGSMMPGSYTGPVAESTPSATRMVTPPSSNVPAPSNETIRTPTDERPMTNTPPTVPPAENAPTVPPAENP